MGMRIIGGCGLALLVLAFAAVPANAGTKQFTATGYRLPAGKAVTIALMRPDSDVGQLQGGGVAQPSADWTRAARDNLAAALRDNQAAKGIALRGLDDQAGDGARLVADYEALHRAVAAAIIEHKYYGLKLPTKKNRFDWTLGPGAQAIGTLAGANYGLFLYTRDEFASDARKAMQVAGVLGCVIGFCNIVTGGVHIAYVSLVELETGDVVWFNILRGSKGDVRTAAGARAMIDAIMASQPTRPGELPRGTVILDPPGVR